MEVEDVGSEGFGDGTLSHVSFSRRRDPGRGRSWILATGGSLPSRILTFLIVCLGIPLRMLSGSGKKEGGYAVCGFWET